MKRRVLEPARAAIIAAVTLCAAGLSLALAMPSYAASGDLELNVGGSGFTATPTKSLLGVSNLVPGSTASGVVGVWNRTGTAGSITLKFVNPVSSENGCTPAELALDPACDPAGPGQLPAHLVFTISTSPDGVAPYVPMWSGSAAQLETGVQAIPALGGGGIEWLQLAGELPVGAGNDTQSDLYDFGIAVVLAGQGSGGRIIPPPSNPTTAPSGPTGGGSTSPSYGVGGVSTHRPDGGSTATIPPGGSAVGGVSAGPGLATTGFDAALITLIGILAILCGALILLRWRASARNR